MIAYRARWIAPVDRPPIQDGCLLCDGQFIRAVGRTADIASQLPTGTAIHDFGDALILPGFVNAHAHLELTCYRGMFPPMPLWPWLEQLLRKRFEPGAVERERACIAQAAAESLDAGVTCVADISRTGLSADALSDSPIRRVCFLELISGARQPPSDAATLEAAFMKHRSRVAPASRWCPPQCTIGISPHAPYTVSPDDYSAAVELARREKVPLTMHYLETREEVDWLEGRPGVIADFLARNRATSSNQPNGPRMADLLARPRAFDANMLLAHVNYADDGAIERIASSRASVVWCPRAHAYYGHASHRWRDMLARGINVCLGTDSAACVPTLSILDELRDARRQCPDAPAATLLNMATLNGATALGLGEHLGSLTPGKRADWLVAPFDGVREASPLEALFDPSAGIEAVFVDGKRG